MDEIASAAWLVNLQTRQDFRPSPLRVRVNDTELAADEQRWSPLLSTTGTAKGKWYAALAAETELPLTTWWQWWRLEVDPAAVAGRRTLRLELARHDLPSFLPAMREAPWGEAAIDTLQRQDNVVHVGGVSRLAQSHTFYGPSISARVSADTSEYRWLVVNDWRFWDDQPVASDTTHSSLVSPSGLPRAMHGELSIRLLVTFRDGHSLVY